MLNNAPHYFRIGLLVLASLAFSSRGQAVTPSSPEVQSLVSKGLKYLETSQEARLGGKCVIGLAFVKSKKPDHPKVAEAVAACHAAMKRGNQGDADTIYSCGIAIIFLCELDSKKYSTLINHFHGALERRQKAHGGWGYTKRTTGDTSQTQYGALAFWTAHQHGISPNADSVERMADWLIRTQTPAGGWGYQGKIAELGKRVEQEEVTRSLTAAAMGSVLIVADLIGALSAGVTEAPIVNVPSALRRPGAAKRRSALPVPTSSLNRQQLVQAILDGNAWMDDNFDIKNRAYQNYYLYALERYKSFQEVMQGDSPDEPEWYNLGYEYLREKQDGEGWWRAGCGKPVDTGFAVLFLLRSTQQSLQRSISGAMLSGRGLPRNLAAAKLSRGQVIVQQARTEVADLLSILDDESAEKLDALSEDPSALVGEVDDQSAQRLAQIVRGGSPEARLLAVRALGRTGDLDYVPTLIFALTDPDRRVVRQARDGLRFASRRFGGYGLSDSFTERQLYDAIEKWKQWYLQVRPEASFALE